MAENYFKTYPNKEGFYKEYGGAFIPPMLEDEMKKITDAYYAIFLLIFLRIWKK